MATIGNLDVANQIVWQPVKEDIVSRPNLTPKVSVLPLAGVSWLGFALTPEAVTRVAREYRKP